MEKSTPVRLTRATQILIAGGMIVLIALGMQIAQPILANLLLAFVITLGIAPIPGWIAKRGVPMWLAFTLTVVLVVVVLLGFIGLFGGGLVSVTEQIPKYEEQVVELEDSIVELLTRLGIDLNTFDVTSFINPGQLAGAAFSIVSAVLGALSNVAVVLVVLLFLMIDALGFREKAAVAMRDKPRIMQAWSHYAVATRRYLWITTWTGAAVGAVNAIFLLAIGVDFAVLWGILAFVFSFIPNIGFLLSLIPPAILALLEFGWVKAVVVIVGFTVINSMVDNVIKPKIIGDDLDLSLATTFISLIVWGWLLGPLGAILAVPLTLLIKHVFLETGDDTRWLADLMAQKPAGRPATSDRAPSDGQAEDTDAEADSSAEQAEDTPRAAPATETD